jgi:hypothetical protein
VAKYKGPYQIVRVLPHNNEEIKLLEQRKSIVHMNKLKPYHSKGQFKIFKDNFQDDACNFQKQGVDVNSKELLLPK